jgi:hypothetical protein
VQSLAIGKDHLMLLLVLDELLVTRVVEVAPLGFHRVAHAFEQLHLEDHVAVLACCTRCFTCSTSSKNLT